MKTLVINRDKDKRRLAFVKDEVARHPELEFERFKAIDAFDADFSVKGSLPPGISFDAPIPQDLKKRGNYGCQLSHVACWHSVAQGDAPVLILHGDADRVIPVA
ncbi:MAG: glycosyltransferase family 25 protein, partial [Pseudomonadota bacterium]